MQLAACRKNQMVLLLVRAFLCVLCTCSNLVAPSAFGGWWTFTSFYVSASFFFDASSFFPPHRFLARDVGSRISAPCHSLGPLLNLLLPSPCEIAENKAHCLVSSSSPPDPVCSSYKVLIHLLFQHVLPVCTSRSCNYAGLRALCVFLCQLLILSRA